MHIRLPAILVAALVACLPLAAQEQSQRDRLVNELISGAADGAECADRLYRAAMEHEGDDETRVFLLEKAVEYGVDRGRSSKAYAVAQKALDALDELQGADKLEVLINRSRLFEKWYRITPHADARREMGARWLDSEIALAEAYVSENQWADAARTYHRAEMLAKSLGEKSILRKLKEPLRRVYRMQQVYAKVRNLRRSLENNPDNTKLRENIIMTYLVELDNPSAAIEYVRGGIDEVLATYVPMAARDVSRLTEPMCLELGRWYYETLFDSAVSTDAQAAMLIRAKDYYRRYLELHEKKDAGAVKAQARLQEIENKLEKYKVAPLEDFMQRVRMISAGYECGNLAKIWVDGKLVVDTESENEEHPAGRGLNMVVWHNQKVVKTAHYDTFAGSTASDKFAADVSKLPDGAFVAVAVMDEATRNFNARAYRAIRSIGGKTNLAEAKYRCSYYCIGQKGLMSGKAVEKTASEMIGYPPEFVQKFKKKRLGEKKGDGLERTKRRPGDRPNNVTGRRQRMKRLKDLHERLNRKADRGAAPQR